jgi:hypothetical protein
VRIQFIGILFVLFNTIVHAQRPGGQNITISGTVVDSATGAGISGAVVVLQPGPSKAEVTAAQAAMQTAIEQGRENFVPQPNARTTPSAR